MSTLKELVIVFCIVICAIGVGLLMVDGILWITTLFHKSPERRHAEPSLPSNDWLALDWHWRIEIRNDKGDVITNVTVIVSPK